MKVEEFVLEVKARADASLGRVRGQMMGMRGAALAVGGAVASVAAGFAGLTAAAAKVADDLAKGARRAGLSAEDYQAFGVAFDRAGVGAGGLERAAKSLAAAQLQAQRGSAEASEAFTRLGVSATDSSGRLREFGDILPDILDALADVESESERLALAQVVLGRAAQGMASLIQGGGDAMRETAARARVLGYTFDGPLRTSAENANDAVADIGLGLRSMALRSVAPLIPLMEDAAVGFRDFLARVKPVIDSRLDAFMGGVVRQFRALSPEVKAIAGGLGLGAVVVGFVRLSQSMAGFLNTIGLGGAVSNLRALALPLLGIAAALLAVDDVLAFARGGDSLTGRLLMYLGGQEAVDQGRRAVDEISGSLWSLADALDALAPTAEIGTGLRDFLGLFLISEYTDGISGTTIAVTALADAMAALRRELNAIAAFRRSGGGLLGSLTVGSEGFFDAIDQAGAQRLASRIPGVPLLAGLSLLGQSDVDRTRLGVSPVGGAEMMERLGVSQTINIDARGASPEQAGRIAREVGQDEAMRIFADLGVPVSVP